MAINATLESLGINTKPAQIVTAYVWPDSVPIAEVRLRLMAATALYKSYIKRTVSVQRLAGGTTDFWEGVITTPPLTLAQSKALRGLVNRLQAVYPFTFTPPDGQYPQTLSGGFPGNGSVNGANQKGNLLASTWSYNNSLVLKSGDRIQVGNQFFVVTEDATTNASGSVSLHIEPAIRSAPANGATIKTSLPLLRARLLSNRVEFIQTRNFIEPVSLAFEEVP